MLTKTTEKHLGKRCKLFITVSIEQENKTNNTFSWPSLLIIEWFSKRTGMSFQNGARSKNVDKKLGRERRRVVLKSDLAVVATRIITSAF